MKNDDSAIKLMLGYLCIANESEASLVRKVEILDRFSLSDSEIAQICSASPQSIRNARQLLKKPNSHVASKKKIS